MGNNNRKTKGIIIEQKYKDAFKAILILIFILIVFTFSDYYIFGGKETFERGKFTYCNIVRINNKGLFYQFYYNDTLYQYKKRNLFYSDSNLKYLISFDSLNPKANTPYFELIVPQNYTTYTKGWKKPPFKVPEYVTEHQFFRRVVPNTKTEDNVPSR